MAQRTEAKDSLDDFPTPPWATRALMEHVLPKLQGFGHLTCLEPACGAGHMAKALGEYFPIVHAADVHDYGYGHVEDFLVSTHQPGSFDWVITNPPFRLAEDFVVRSLEIARCGVAIFARTNFIETVGRYRRIFVPNPPLVLAQFTERVPILRGRLDRKKSTATAYAWFVWEKEIQPLPPRVSWIPPCRRDLEKDTDYNAPKTHFGGKNARKLAVFDGYEKDLFGT